MNSTAGFSDTQFGWSYYLAERQTRHSSNYNGTKYPYNSDVRYEIGSVMGLYVDLIEGTIAYKFGGEYHGVAHYLDPSVPYYIAVCHYEDTHSF